MFSRRLWSSLRSPWRKARPAEPRTGSTVKLGMLLLEDRILLTSTPLAFNAPANQPLVATLRVVQDPAGPQLELIDNAAHVLAQQTLAATSQVSITGSPLDDTLTIDQSTPINLPITYTGGGAADATGDRLIVTGGGPTTYTPIAGASDQGTLQTAGSTITFSGLQAATVHDVQGLTFTPPGDSGELVVDSPAAGQNRISGTSDGTGFVPVTYYNVPAVMIDTSPHETATGVDRIAVGASGLVAGELQNFTVKTGAGANRLTVYGTDYTLPASGGAFAFQGGGSGTLEGPSASTRGTLSSLPGDNGSSIALTGVQRLLDTPSRPLVVVPGFAGSFATPAATGAWFTQIGLPPADLQVGPLKNEFGDLLTTLQNAGYDVGQSLFLAPWDWRVPVAPSDSALDGLLSNVTAASITGNSYGYGVNYLGHALVTASTTWAGLVGSAPADVDMVTHSTGGLIARAYIQSAAYGAAADLPRVNNLIDVAVPNQGVTEVWNLLQNNWGLNTGNRLLSNIVNLGYQRVLAGETIATPSGPISLASITTAGAPDPQKFIALYVGSLRDLLPTFDFVIDGNGNLTTINNNAAVRNNLLLDLNDGQGVPSVTATDISSFVHGHTLHPQNTLDGTLTSVYASSTPTTDEAIQETGNTGVGLAPIVPLGNVLGRSPNPGETWYSDHTSPSNGDGTVLAQSAIGQFSSTDPGVQVNLVPPAAGTQNNHTGLLANPTAEGDVLTALGRSFQSTDVSTGHQFSTLQSAEFLLKTFVLAFTQDPEQALIAGQAFLSGVQQVGQFIDATITNISQNGLALPTVSVAPASLKLGSFLQVSNPVLSLQNITYVPGSAPGTGHFSGSIGITADAGVITIGQHFTANLSDGTDPVGNPLPAVNGSVDLNSGAFTFTVGQASVSVPNLFTGTASDFQFGYNPGVSGHQQLASINNLSADILPLHDATATLNNLQVFTDGFSLNNATVGVSSFTLDKQIVVTNPKIALSGIRLNVSSGGVDSEVGSFSVSADSVALFPNQTSFAASLANGKVGYDFGQNALSMSADSLDVKVKDVLDVHATGLSFNLNVPQQTFSIGVGAASATSPKFPDLSATVTNLQISQANVSFDNATLTAPADVTVGKFLDLQKLQLEVDNFSYTTTGGLGSTTSITATADQAALFPKATTFTATVGGFSGTFSFGTGAISWSATSLSMDVGKVLHIAGSNLGLQLDPIGQTFSLTVGSATATSDDFVGASATVTNLQLNQGGLSFDTLDLTAPDDVKVGKYLDLHKFDLKVTSFQFATAGSVTGATIEATADTVKLFPDQHSFSATVTGFDGLYDLTAQTLSFSATDLNLDVGRILHIDGANLGLTMDALAGTFTLTVGMATGTSPDFDGASATVKNLQISQAGVSFDTLTLTAPAEVKVASYLDLANFSLTVSGFNYTAGSTGLAGATFKIGADSVSLFPDQAAFKATVTGFSGSYDVASAALSLSATGLTVTVGKLVEVDSSSLGFTLDPQAGTFAIMIGMAKVTSPDFDKAEADVTNLSIDQTGFQFDTLKLKAPDVTIGSVLDLNGFSLTVSGFNYSAGGAGFSAASISFQTDSVTLFQGHSGFTATVTNFGGSYNFQNSALALSADSVDINFGQGLLDFQATGISFGLNPFQVHLKSASVSSTKLDGFQGSLTDLQITSDGFSVGSVTIGPLGDIKLGSIFSFSGLSVTFTNFGYSLSEGASFQGSIGIGADSATLTLGSAVTASATKFSTTVDLDPAHLGQFTLKAGTVTLTIGTYLELDGKNVAFDSSALGTSSYLAQFGEVDASLPGVGISGAGKNFAIDGNGGFHALTDFGVSLALGTSLDKLKWPSWLPVQVTYLALNWADFNAHPDQFDIHLSASVDLTDFFQTGLILDGFVDNAVIDVGKLEANQFPITSVDGAGLELGGSFLGLTIKGGVFFDIVSTDSSGAVTTDPTKAVNHYFYAGITATVNVEGLEGVSLRFAFSQLGPLDIYLEYDNAQILDPDTGLAITGFHAGIKFAAPLPALTDAKQLYQDPLFKPEGTTSLDQWKTGLADQVANQIAHSDSITDLLSQPYLIQGGATLFDAYATEAAFTATGDILIDTDGHLGFEGTITFGGGDITASGAVFVDLSQIQSQGKAGIFTYLQVPAAPDPALVTFDGSLVFQFGQHQTLPAGVIPVSNTPSNNFTVTLTGDLDFSIAKVADFDINGTATFQIHFDPNNLLLSPIQLNVSGELSVHAGPISGDLGGLAGVLHLQVVQNANGSLSPQAWGAFVVEPGNLVHKLQPFGLDLNGIAVFEFNLTGDPHQETLTIPGQATPQLFNIAPSAADILITGSVTFTLPVLNVNVFTLDGTVGLFFSAPDGGSPVLDALLSGEIVIGPSNNPFVKLAAVGFLQINSAGVAAQFDVTLDQDPQLAAAGLAIGGNFHIDLNTTSGDVDYQIPDNLMVLPGVPSTQLNMVHVSGAPAGSTVKQRYFSVDGTGNFNLLNDFALTGQLHLLVTSAGLVANFAPLDATTPNLLLKVGNTTLVSFLATGAVDVSFTNDTLVGYLSLQVAINNGNTFGLGFNGSFVLEVNTTSQDQPFTLNGATFTVHGTAPGQTQPGPYIVVQGMGTVTLQTPQVTLPLANGSFDFEVSPSGLLLDVAESVNLAPLGSFNVAGHLGILSSGVVGSLSVTGGVNFSQVVPGVSGSASLQVLVNTTGSAQTSTGFVVSPSTGQVTLGRPVTIQPGFEADLGGTLSAGGFNLMGQFDLAVGSGSVDLHVNASVSALGFTFGVHGDAVLTSQNFYLDLFVSVGGSFSVGFSAGDFSVSGNVALIIDVANQHYELQVTNASVSALGFTASGSLDISVNGGSFYIGVPASNPLSLDFFGIATISLSGYLDSAGDFSLTAGGGFSIGDWFLGASGSFSVTISNTGFSGSAWGEGHALGISVGAGGSIYIDSGYVKISVGFSIAGHDHSITVTLGQQGEVVNNPIVSFLLPTTQYFEGTPITAITQATLLSGDPSTLTYNWQVYLGDNTNYLSSTPYPFSNNILPNWATFTPNQNGDYTIAVTVTNPAGGSTTITKTITVQDVPPTAQITAGQPSSVAQGQTVSFTGSATDLSSVAQAAGFTYSWTVNGPGPAIAPGTGAGFSFKPLVPGTYHVTLTATGNRDGTATASYTFTVTNVPPTIQQLTFPSEGVINTTYTASATATDPGGGADLLTYHWTLTTPPGDTGATLGLNGQPTITLKPDKAGVYTLTLTVTDSFGGQVTQSTSMIVFGSVIPVTSAADNTSGTPAAGTLRAAIAATEGTSSSETIVFDASLAGQTIALAMADPYLSSTATAGPSGLIVAGSNVTLDGSAAPGLTIARASGAPAMRLFYVAANDALVLKDIALTGGLAQGGVGGSNTSLDNAPAAGGGAGLGGAILNEGSLTLQGATLYANTALGGAGGFSNFLTQGPVQVPAVPGSPNGGHASAPAGFGGGSGGGGTAGFGGGATGSGAGGGGAGLGGAIFNDVGATLLVNDSTFSGNAAQGGAGGALYFNNILLGTGASGGQGLGGAIFNDGVATIQYSTLAKNSVTNGAGTTSSFGAGGAVYTLGGSLAVSVLTGTGTGAGALTLQNSILADSTYAPSQPATDVAGRNVNYAGSTNNLIQLADDPAAGSALVADPLLLPLANYGGPTLTFALPAHSPAIGHGNSIGLSGSDQRGLPRDAQPDLGAYEYAGTLLVNSTADMLFDAPAGALTLPLAVNLATFSPGAPTIAFAPQLAGLTIALGTARDTTYGPTALRISSPVTIDGSAAPQLTITRVATVNNLRLFYVAAAGTLTLENLTLSGGLAQGGAGGNDIYAGGGGGAGLGGALFNDGQVQLLNDTLSDNAAQGGAGGEGDGTVGGFGGSGGGPNGSLFALFPAGFGGGGAGALDRGAGIISGRSGGFGGGAGGQGGSPGFGGGASDYGGGGGAGLGGAVFNNLGASLTIDNSTFYSNSAIGGAGGPKGSSPDGQAGDGYGGAIFNRAGHVDIENTTFANDTVAAPSNGTYTGVDIWTMTDSGTSATANLVNDLFAPTSSLFGFVQLANFFGTVTGSDNLLMAAENVDPAILIPCFDPQLDPRGLQNNGGPTPTVALQTASPAIDAGMVNTLTTDQRGQPRDAAPDIGAYEFAPPTVSISDVTQYEGNSGTTAFVFTVSLSHVPQAIDVNYQTVDLTALAGSDYTAVQGTLHFVPGGPRSQTIAVLVNADTVGAPDRTFGVNLSLAAGTPASVSITKAQGLGTILNDDPLFLVNSLADTATAPHGTVTLREAVNALNEPSFLNLNLPGTIEFAPSLAGQTLALATIGDTSFGNSALIVFGDVTISGDPALGLTLAPAASAPSMRAFYVNGEASLTLENVTLSGWTAQGGAGADAAGINAGFGGGGGAGLGGAIYNGGTLTLTNGTLTGNQAIGGNGGGNYATVAGSPGGNGGGPIAGLGANGHFEIPGGDGGFGSGGGGGTVGNGTSLFSLHGGNGGFGGGAGGGGGSGFFGTGGLGGFGGGSAPGLAGAGGGAGFGGAIYNDYGATLVITGSTLNGNSAIGGNGAAQLDHSATFAGAGGAGYGGAVFNRNGTVTINGSILRNNIIQGGAGTALAPADGGGVYSYQDPAVSFDAAVLNIGYDTISDNLIGPPPYTPDPDLVNNGGTVQPSAPGVINAIQNYSGFTGTNFVSQSSTPIPDAGGPYTTQQGATLILDATKSLALHGIMSYEWDLAYQPGQPFHTDVTSKRPHTPVSFSSVFASGLIALRVTDSSGNTAIATTTVTVTDVAPTLVTFQVPAIGQEGTPLKLSASATDPGGFTDSRGQAADQLTFHWTVLRNGQPFLTVNDVVGGSSTTGSHNAATFADALTFTPATVDSAADTYTASLTVTDAFGASVSTITGQPLSASISVANVPPTITSFTVPPLGTAGSPVQVSATASDPGGAADTLAYQWSVAPPAGDTGTTHGPTNQTSFTFTPDVAGDYVVQVTVTDAGGASTMSSQTITVTAANAVGPTIDSVTLTQNGATLAVPYNAAANKVVRFAASATSQSTPASTVSYFWDFGDGQTATGASVSHTYTAIGDYHARLKVTDMGGVSVQLLDVNVPATPLIKAVTVSQNGGALAAPYTVTEGQTLGFNAAAVSQSPVATVLSNLWDFGDGTTVSGASAFHAYADDGVYHVRLLVSDLTGTSEQDFDVTVNAVPLNPSLSGVNQINEASTYTLNLNANPDAQPVTAWTINWGDGSDPQVVTDNVSSVTHFYADGTATIANPQWQVQITATATNEDGTFSTNMLPVTVNFVAPTFTITGNGEVKEGDTYTLNLNASGLGAGSITGWTIYWGDSLTPATFAGSPASVSHVYADGPNDYHVMAFATFDDGTQQALALADDGTFSAHSIKVHVDPVPPTVTLTGAATTPAGMPYTLGLAASDVDGDAINNWTVAWGDGTTSTTAGSSASLTHAYATGGHTYTISATATDADGLSTTATLNVTVVSLLLAGTAFQVNEGTPYSVNLSAPGISDQTVQSGTISWGDNTSSPITSLGSLSHTYTAPGSYVLSASITNLVGNLTANTLTVVVNAVPGTASINGASHVAEGSLYTLNLAARDYAGNPASIASWTISWGDGRAQTIAGNPGSATHYYTQAGATYTITATATDTNGLHASASGAGAVQVTVDNVAPTLSVLTDQATSEGSALNLPNLATFTDPGTGEVFAYQIAWGDGTATDTGLAATVGGGPGVLTTGAFGGAHAYGEDGTYRVTVTVADSNGGSDTKSFQVTVSEVTPTLNVVGEQQTSLGQTLSLPVLGTFTDTAFALPPALEGYTYSINWGDVTPATTGTVTNVVQGAPGQPTAGTFGSNHLYTAAGSYLVTATLTDGDRTSVSQSFHVQVSQVDTDPEVTSTKISSTYGDAIQFTAAVSSMPGLPTPHGTVAFYDNGSQIDSEALDSTGHATSRVLTGLGTGTHRISASYSGDSNYTNSASPVLLQSVNPAVLSVRANPNQAMPYGGTLPILTATISGFQNGETLATSGVLGAPRLQTVPANSHAGTYALIVSTGTLAAANYTFTFGNDFFTITPVALTITADNQVMTYGGSRPTLTASYSGLVNGDSATTFTHGNNMAPTLATTSATSHVGGYPITVSGAVDTDYVIRYVPGTLTINPAALTITADSKTMSYGGSRPKLTASYSGLVNGDTSSAVTGLTLATVPASSHVGSYPITASGAMDADYAITYVPGTLTINPVALTITADSKTMTYGGSRPTLTASYSGLVNGDTPTSLRPGPQLATVPTSSPAGSYAITVSGAQDPDYVISYGNGTLTINRAALTITADSKTRVYGAPNPALTASYSGLVNGDTPASLQAAAALATAAMVSSPAGNYPITVSGATSPNYTIVFVAGNLAITPDPTTTTGSASATLLNYGQVLTLTAVVTPNAPGTGIPAGSVDFFDTTTAIDLGLIPLTAGQAALTTSALGVGNHTITLTYGGSGNYQTSSTSVTVSVFGAVMVLDPTASGALSLTGNAHLTVSGPIEVNSSSASAISASGNATVTATSIQVVGSVSASGHASLQPNPITHVAHFSDPLQSLRAPSATGLQNFGAINVSGNTSMTIQPGIYTQISVAGNGKLTLAPGIYILAGGGLTVSGNGTITGSAVLLYNAGGKYPMAGGTFGKLTLSGNANVSLTPAVSGTYAGVVFFQSRDNTGALSLSGNAILSLHNGVLYAPAALLTESGNAQILGPLLVDQFQLSGNALSTPSAASTPATPAPTTPAPVTVSTLVANSQPAALTAVFQGSAPATVDPTALDAVFASSPADLLVALLDQAQNQRLAR